MTVCFVLELFAAIGRPNVHGGLSGNAHGWLSGDIYGWLRDDVHGWLRGEIQGCLSGGDDALTHIVSSMKVSYSP